MPLRNFKLPLEAKRHIVCALARKTRYADIMTQVRERFGITIHIRALAHYTPHNARLDPELKTLYEETKAQHWRELQEESDRWWAASREATRLENEASRAAMKAQMKAKLLEKISPTK